MPTTLAIPRGGRDGMAKAPPQLISTIGAWITVIGVPALLLFIGITLAWTIGASRELGSIDARLEQHGTTLERLAADMKAGFDRMDVANANLAQRIFEAETDPKALLARAGIAVDPSFTAAFVEGTTVIFPVFGAAAERLEQQGYKAYYVTPYLQGWVPEGAVVPDTWEVVPANNDGSDSSAIFPR